MHIPDLEYNGIFLSKEPAHEGVLPQHIDRVRAILLDFTCTIDDIESADLHTDEQALVKHYEPIRDDAERLHKGKDREVEWQTFFLINFFRPLENEMRVTDEDKRQRARTKFYYEYFESAQSRPWTLFGQKTKGKGRNRVVVEKGFRQDERTGLTAPKPDWVAFFPIYDFENERIQTSKRWPLSKGATKAMIENFEHTTLKHLAEYGVESNTAALFRKERNQWILSDCISFPWLIVEHKREGGAAVEEECYCQAANAGTAAVMMLETLFAGERGPNRERNKANEHIPSVVTMTTVDKTVRVWITYSCKPSDHDTARYRMDCIWKGDMTVALDLIRFRTILENTHTWAIHDQRPRISTYIDLWKLKHPMDPPKAACESTPKSAIPTDSASTSATKAALTEPSSPVPSLSPILTAGERTTESEGSLLNQGQPTDEPDSNYEPGSDEESEHDKVLTTTETAAGEVSTGEEALTERELVKWGESTDASDGNYEPGSDEKAESDEVSTTTETAAHEESVGEKALTEGEPGRRGEPTSEEEPTLKQPTTHEEPLEEPPSTPPQPQYSTSLDLSPISAHRLPVSSIESPGSTQQDTNSGSKAKQSELPPEITTHVGIVHASSRPNGISKKALRIPWERYPGRSIRVKLPDVGARESSPPMIPAALEAGPAPTSPKYNLFGVSWNLAGPAHVGGSQTSASTVDWPAKSNVDFVAAFSKYVESKPDPRPRKLPLSDFTDGVFNDFAKPGAAKMHLPFTPPASTNSTPLKQQPLRETVPARPRSPSDERAFWLQGLRAALPPTPEPTPDGKTDRGRGRPILDVYSDDEGF